MNLKWIYSYFCGVLLVVSFIISGCSKSTGDNMILVKGSCFDMGYDVFDSAKTHKECIADYLISKFEVTQQEWVDVMGSNPSQVAGPDNLPVDSVNYNDVQEYIKKLNNKTGKKYRLPTSAEWEYAARSGGKEEVFSGLSAETFDATVGMGENFPDLYLYANFRDVSFDGVGDRDFGPQNDGYKETAPVGSFKPNGLGIYDMTGNVAEWVSDICRKDKRMTRGGSYSNSGVMLLITGFEFGCKIPSFEGFFYSDSGLRVAMDASSNK